MSLSNFTIKEDSRETMKIMFKPLLIAVFLLVNTVSQATEEQYAELKMLISKSFPGAEITGFKDSAIPDVLEFNLGAQVLYVTKNGRFLFKGDIYDLVTQENITEKSAQASRVATLEAFGEENMLVYKAKDQKHFVTVFTDIDCPYCRRLHDEIDEYLAKGISVRYFFLPFKGKKSLEKSVSVWCSKNPTKAMTDAKKGRRIRSATCEHPIDAHMGIGRDFGIRGTPAIVLENGEMIPGYRPVKDVAKMLESKK